MEYSPHLSYGFRSHKALIGWNNILYENVYAYSDTNEPEICWWLYATFRAPKTDKEIALRDQYAQLIFEITAKKSVIQREVNLVGAMKTNTHWIFQFRDANNQVRYGGWGSRSYHRKWETISIPINECSLPDFFGREPTVEELEGFSLESRAMAASAYKNPKFCLGTFDELARIAHDRSHDEKIIALAITNLKDYFGTSEIPKKYWADYAKHVLENRYRRDVIDAVKGVLFDVKKRQEILTTQIVNEYIALYGAYNLATSIITTHYRRWGGINFDLDYLKNLREKVSPDLVRTILGIPNKFAEDNQIAIHGPTERQVFAELGVNFKQLFETHDKESRALFWKHWNSKRRKNRSLKDLANALEDHLTKKEEFKQIDESPKLPQLKVPEIISIDGREFKVHQCATIADVKKLGRKFKNCLRNTNYDVQIANYANILTGEHDEALTAMAVFALIPKVKSDFQELGLCFAAQIIAASRNPDTAHIRAKTIVEETINGKNYIIGFPVYGTGICTGYTNDTPNHTATMRAYEAFTDFMADPPTEIPTRVSVDEGVTTTSRNPVRKSKWVPIDTY